MNRIVGIIAGISLAAGCGQPADQKEKIKIGAIISLTGNYGALGSERLNGAVLAVEEINKAGGVLGKELELVPRDDGTEPTNAKKIAEDMVRQGMPAIIGAAASGSTVAISDVTIPGQVVSISGSSTSPLITSLQDDGFVNRTCAADALQSRLIAQRARGRGFTKMAVIYAPNAYGEGLANAFNAAFTGLGGTITGMYVAESGQTSYEALLTRAYEGAPESILLITYTVEGVQVIKDYLAKFSDKGTFWWFPDSLADSAFVTAVGPSKFTFGHEGTGPAAPKGERYEAFAAAYQAKFGKTPETTSFSANYYDATYLLALAIEAAGKAEGPAIRDNLQNVSMGGESFDAKDFSAAVAELKVGGDINYEGASGSVDLDQFGEPIAPYDVWKVQDGALTVIESSVNP
ncbi:MAG: ABC transporter substrate-binding protein [Myxococcaceae bacterium]